jgi:retron-type reverse transcriptase
MGLSIADVNYLIATAPRRYKVFTIPKRNNGMREIAQPSRELKKLQRLLVNRVLQELPLHEAAHGYVSKRGIRTNAIAHVASEFILKMDLVDFFPSIRPSDFKNHLRNYLPDLLVAEEVLNAVNILFWKPKGDRTLRLCIGAPSSPAMSNSIMYDIDRALADMAAEKSVTYTRYADDLTFSCNKKSILSEVERAATVLIEGAAYPKVKVNQEKTIHISRAQRRMVTGIVLTATKQLSLGRERKRAIRVLAHRFKLNQLDEKQAQEFFGFLAFAQDIEPSFAEMIRRRADLI